MAGEAGRGKGKTEEYIVYFLALGGGGEADVWGQPLN